MATQLNFPADALQQLGDVVRHIGVHSPGPRSLALASAVRGEGVTTAAAALAGCLARQHQLRVLLLDANLRSPRQHELFDIPRDPGFSDLLRDRVDGSGAAGTAIEEGLQVLPAGTEVGNPERYLVAAALKERIAHLGAGVDWVIVDCAPVNAYPDAQALAAACSAVVLVVRSGRTRREVVLDAKRTLTQAGANLAGIVLNRRRYYIPEALYRWL